MITVSNLIDRTHVRNVPRLGVIDLEDGCVKINRKKNGDLMPTLFLGPTVALQSCVL